MFIYQTNSILKLNRNFGIRKKSDIINILGKEETLENSISLWMDSVKAWLRVTLLLKIFSWNVCLDYYYGPKSRVIIYFPSNFQSSIVWEIVYDHTFSSSTFLLHHNTNGQCWNRILRFLLLSVRFLLNHQSSIPFNSFRGTFQNLDVLEKFW